MFVWEGESVADLQFMDAFNHVGELTTFPAFDRTGGLQAAFAGDIDRFRDGSVRNAMRMGASREQAEQRAQASVDLRARALRARTREAALAVARAWRAEREGAGDRDA